MAPSAIRRVSFEAVDLSQMHRPKRLRFSLAALMLMTTALAVGVGFVQARRNWIVREAEALRAEGCFISVPAGWDDELWPTAPPAAGIFVLRWSGKYKIGAETYTLKEAQARCKDLEQRLKALGVMQVRLGFSNSSPYSIEKSVDEFSRGVYPKHLTPLTR
jgi:hypothetical protein